MEGTESRPVWLFQWVRRQGLASCSLRAGQSPEQRRTDFPGGLAGLEQLLSSPEGVEPESQKQGWICKDLIRKGTYSTCSPRGEPGATPA